VKLGLGVEVRAEEAVGDGDESVEGAVAPTAATPDASNPSAMAAPSRSAEVKKGCAILCVGSRNAELDDKLLAPPARVSVVG
jgi:hypothetical protein